MSQEAENNTPKFDLNARVEDVLGIDLRSLGVFRIAIGGMLLIDLIIRATSLAAHYTDAGVAPRALVFEYGEQPWLLSFHMLSGGLALQIVLFVIAGCCALALMAGYRSRMACFFCWLLTLSLHVRNPFVNNLGDWLLVDLLFWGMFLPVGAAFSLDKRTQPATAVLPVRIVSIGTLAILVQVCFVYFFSVHRKTGPVWHTDGTAVAFALNLDRITTGWGQALLNLPEGWLKFMTFATLHLERWGPLLVFLPFVVGPWRTAVICCFISFHIGLALFFELGIFPWICISAWLLFLPTWFWDGVGERVFRLLRGPEWIRSWSDPLIRWMQGKGQRPIKTMPGLGETLVGAAFLFGVLSSALLYGGLMDETYYDKIYKHVEPVVNTLNMKQRWDMFSPQPPRNDGWFVVAAYSGEKVVDLFRPDAALRWDRPENIAKTYMNQRWRKYFEWVMNKPQLHAKHLEAYGKALYLKHFPEAGPLTRVNVYFMHESTLPGLETSGVDRRKLN